MLTKLSTTKLTTLASLVVLALAAPSAADAQTHRPRPERHQTFEDGNCGAELNFLPRIVRKEEIQAIPPNANVLLHTICEGEQMADFGNVGALDRTIAANPALAAALRSQGLTADEVVGINIHDNGMGVDLYIHVQ